MGKGVESREKNIVVIGRVEGWVKRKVEWSKGGMNSKATDEARVEARGGAKGVARIVSW
jgi:hypothetical protein